MAAKKKQPIQAASDRAQQLYRQGYEVGWNAAMRHHVAKQKLAKKVAKQGLSMVKKAEREVTLAAEETRRRRRSR